MDTDPANEYFYYLCVSCANKVYTVKSDNFTLQTYYPCEDSLIKSSLLQNGLDMVLKIIEKDSLTVETRDIF
jgi:hypothetical protein